MNLYYEEILKNNIDKYEDRISLINSNVKNLNGYTQAILGELTANKISLSETMVNISYEELKHYANPSINSIDQLLKNKLRELKVIKETLLDLNNIKNDVINKYMNTVIEISILELEKQLEKVQSYIPSIWKDLIIMISIDTFNVDKYDVDFPIEFKTDKIFQLNFEDNSIICIITDRHCSIPNFTYNKIIDVKDYRIFYDITN